MARHIDPDEPLVRTGVFGQQVEDFLQTDIGDYLLQRAKLEEREAIEELIRGFGSLTTDQLFEVRARIWQARKFQEWLGRAVEMGMQALEMLKEEE